MLALKAIRAGISLIGCGEVCQIAQYATLEEVLGTSKFDALFAADSPTPFDDRIQPTKESDFQSEEEVFDGGKSFLFSNAAR